MSTSSLNFAATTYLTISNLDFELAAEEKENSN